MSLTDNRINKLLRKKIKKQSLYNTLLTEEGVFAGLSVGDLFYDYLRVDPLVVRALDASHPNLDKNYDYGIEDLSNPIKAGWFKKKRFEDFEKESSNPEKSWSHHESRDSGYYAERHYGHQFQSQGSEVEFPEDPNNPGFDLIVNKTPIQSKLGSGHLLDKHFEKYPDIKVVANNQAIEDHLIRHPENANKVFYGGDGKVIQQHYLDNSESMQEIIEDEEFFSLPISEAVSVGLIISAGRNSYKFIQNKKSFNEALVDTGIDTASRAGSISLSAGVGSIIIGTLSGGPYGYIAGKFVGGILGLYPGRKISTIIKHSIRCKDEQDILAKAIKNYLEKLSSIFKENNKTLEKKYEFLEANLAKGNKTNQEIWKLLKLKLEDETKYKKAIDSKIKNSIKDVYFLDQKAECLSSLADEAIFLGNKIGIGPSFLEKESIELVEASKKYNKCIEKIF
jgi:hypothetical protein|tara:strand:- start:115 stop:1467 length:1353 start_codon:yes stop_codon:yes gene_type:complete